MIFRQEDKTTLISHMSTMASVVLPLPTHIMDWLNMCNNEIIVLGITCTIFIFIIGGRLFLHSAYLAHSCKRHNFPAYYSA